MKKTFSKKEKESIIKEHLKGKTITTLAKEFKVSRTSLYSWKKDYLNGKKAINIADYQRLKEQLAKEENIIKILQTTSEFVNLPSIKKYDTITELSDQYSITTLCEALKVAKGSYYNHISRAKRENSIHNKRRAELEPIIEEIYNTNKQIYDAGKIAAIMKDRGYIVSKQFVANIMHQNNWFSIRSYSKTLYLQNKKRKENILNQNFKATRLNEIWVSDVTYFKLNNKTYYICVIIDLYARKVVAVKTSQKNSTQLVKSTFKLAYDSRNIQNDLLFHTDRGSNYTSKTFMNYLDKLGVTQSFSRKATPYDNSVCESFFSNMKREELYRTNYRSEKEFLQSVKNYIIFYNSERPHNTNMNLTPNRKEANFLSSTRVATT